MGSSHQNSKKSGGRIYDPIRKRWVDLTPEERVRQRVLSYLQTKGFPSSLIAVERSVADLLSFSGREHLTPKRRVDLLCYASIRGEISPLLLIECKAGVFQAGGHTSGLANGLEQLCGYNSFLHAPFIAVVNEIEIHFSSFPIGEKVYCFIPSYQEMVHFLEKRW